MILVACQLSTQDPPDAAEPLKLANASEQCMSDSLHAIEGYFKATAKTEEVDAAFSCFSSALDMLANHGKGTSKPTGFTPGELRALLQKHFFDDGTKLTDGLLLEVMRVKQALLGGDADLLTKDEVVRLIGVFDIVRREAMRLHPYIRVLNQSIDRDQLDPSFLEQAISDFTYSMNTLGALLGQNKEAYKFENLRNLLQEFQGLYRGRSAWKGPDWFAKQMPLIASAKALLVRPGGDSIAPDEWNAIFGHVGQFYGLFLRFKYMIADRDYFSPDALAQIEIGLDEVFDIVDEAIDAKGNGRIDYALINDFTDALIGSKAFNTEIQAKTLRDVMPILFERVLNPPVVSRSQSTPLLDPKDPQSARGVRPPQGGLTKTSLESLRLAVFGWIEMQRTWDQLETNLITRNPQRAGKPIPIRTVRAAWSKLSAVHQEAWADLKAIFDQPFVSSINPSGIMQIGPANKIVMDRKSFTALNWKQTLVRVLGNAYISNPVKTKYSGVTLSQFETLFKDLRPILTDLRFLDPDEDAIFNTGFIVSNIFLFSANGDDRLSFFEATDLFVSTFSSSGISKRVRADADQICAQKELDPAGVPKIEAQCWRKQFRSEYASYFAELPEWKKHAGSFTNDQWEAFLNDTEKAIRRKGNDTPLLRNAEMGRAVSIHHYVESVYARWDADRNGELSVAEGDKAFYLFEPILTTASGFKDRKEVRALFFYLLANGKAPETLREKLDWLRWKREETEPEWEKAVHANRARIMQIFGGLAANL